MRCGDREEVGKCTEVVCLQPVCNNIFVYNGNNIFVCNDNNIFACNLRRLVPQLKEWVDVVVDGEDHPESVVFHQLLGILKYYNVFLGTYK